MRPLVAARLRALDALDVLRGRWDPLVPPRRLRGRVGDSDFVATGDELARLAVELAGLRPGHRVLDLGCGYGRVARALAARLGPQGSYEGFDASPEAVKWCRRRYARRHPGFRFEWLDVRNSAYHPEGEREAREVVFPYADASFDVAIAASLFPHLLADGTDRYLAEAARVLRPGGRLLATFLLRDGELEQREREIVFLQEHWPVAIADPQRPEAVVGHDEAWVRDRLGEHGLTLQEPVRRGTWAGGAGPGYQDVIVAAA